MKINKKNIYLIFTAFYIYFTMALFETSKGNFIPFFLEEFKVNNATLSLVISMGTVGCVIGSFLGGLLCDKKGHKFVFIFGSIISTISVFIAPFTNNIFQLGLFYFLFGIGRSSLSIAVDSMVPVLSIGFEVILMNVTHFMYGVGSFTGQSAYGNLLSNGVTWRIIYAFMGIFFALSVVLTLFMKTPNMHVIENRAKAKKDLYKNPLIYMFVAVVTFELVSEAAITTWFITYMRLSYGLNPADAGKYASIFFLSFAIGRLLGGFIINKLGDLRGLIIFLFLGSLLVFTGLFLRESGLLLISLSGFFLSVGFPTLMVIVNKTFNLNASFAIGLITTISNVLYVIFFNLIGLLNDVIGSYNAFYSVPILMLSCMVMLIVITQKSKELK